MSTFTAATVRECASCIFLRVAVTLLRLGFSTLIATPLSVPINCYFYNDLEGGGECHMHTHTSSSRNHRNMRWRINNWCGKRCLVLRVCVVSNRIFVVRDRSMAINCRTWATWTTTAGVLTTAGYNPCTMDVTCAVGVVINVKNGLHILVHPAVSSSSRNVTS